MYYMYSKYVANLLSLPRRREPRKSTPGFLPVQNLPLWGQGNDGWVFLVLLERW